MARQRRPKTVFIDTGEPTAPQGETSAKKKRGKRKKKGAAPVEPPKPKTRREEMRDYVRELKRKKQLEREAAEANKPIKRMTKDGKLIMEEAEETQPTKTIRRPHLLVTALFGFIALIVLAAFIFIPLDERQVPETNPIPQEPNCLGIQPDVREWDYALHEFECAGSYWQEGDDLAEWLLDHGVSYRNVIIIQEKISKNRYPPIGPGNFFSLLHKGNTHEPYLLAYQPNASEYVLLKTEGEADVLVHQVRVVDRKHKTASVYIQETLADAMFNREFGLKLTEQMEAALKWKVDFFHLDPGDHFQLLFDELAYEGGQRDIGKVAAIRYKMNGEVHYAFHYDNGFLNGYFDEDGYPTKTGFLKAPLKYGRISSPYNLNRPDPWSGVTRAHLGTDYAAPTGTPILAVADGVVTHAELKGNNGNYVKIKHNEQIQTQYLHMSKFATGIVPGVEVRQGDVIGYVGMTGRATGPHVCFRFWKDGQQVDHRQERGIQASPPLHGMALESFLSHRDSLWQLLEPI